MPAHLDGCFQAALTERRPATALPSFDQGNTKTNCLKNLDGGNPDMWFVVTDEGVVPKNHFAARGRARLCRASMQRLDRVSPYQRGSRAFMKPVIEPLVCVMRQRPFIGYTQHLAHQ